MTKKEKKRIKTIILRSCVIGLFVIFLAVCIIGWHGSLQIKSWHIFTNSRIEKLEEFYEIDFPEDTEFSSYNAVWIFTDIFRTVSVKHTLYIKDVADPEKFCLENFSEATEIMYMADLKNSRILKNDCYSEEYGKTIANNSDKNEKWSIGERHVDFFCHAYCSEPKINCKIYDIYFSANDNGGYDVKMFTEEIK